MSHYIVPDQQNSNIDFGRFLHEHTYQRKKKEIVFGNVKFDVLLQKGDELVIGETKKSSRYSEASKWQLMFYLQILKKAGIQASGMLLYPQEKKREKIVLDDKSEELLNQMIFDIKKISEQTIGNLKKLESELSHAMNLKEDSVLLYAFNSTKYSQKKVIGKEKNTPTVFF